ncbi:MAG: shikimate kinase [Syntrophaceae bacterium]|nr:shikimate kinase [Syntrophaceae bacterium]
MNLILIGLRASGKTSVGKKLSRLLGFSFYDTDELIRRQTGKTVREMVQEGGWPGFRRAEREVIAGLAGKEESVIALGGGAVLDPANVEALKPRGFFIWLQAERETIQERLQGDRGSAEQRPPLSGSADGGEEEIRKRRIPFYEAVADLTFDTTGLSVEGVAEEIFSAVKNRGLSGRGKGGSRTAPTDSGRRLSFSAQGRGKSLGSSGDESAEDGMGEAKCPEIR